MGRRSLRRLLLRQQGVYLGTVKTDDHLVVEGDDRDAILARLLDHLLGAGAGIGDVVLSELDAFSRKILFRLVTIRSGRSRVDDDVHAGPLVELNWIIAFLK